MKVFWVLSWSTYYPSGGLGNVKSQWETREEADAAAILLRDEYFDDFVVVQDVSEMIGIGEKA